MKRIAAAVVGLLVTAGLSQAQEAAVDLVRTPALAKDLAAFPRLSGSGDVVQKINKALGQGDQRVKKAAKTCRSEGKEHSSWTRKVDVTMRGPRYVSYVAHDDFFCGGAYPDTSSVALVYDLATGIPVDWTKLLAGPPSAATNEAADGTVLGTVSSPKLKELYLAAVKITDVDDPHECDDILRETDFNFILWPDVKENAVVLAQMDLPHVTAACGPAASVPMAKLRQAGFDAGLLDAIEAAHKAAKE